MVNCKKQPMKLGFLISQQWDSRTWFGMLNRVPVKFFSVDQLGVVIISRFFYSKQVEIDLAEIYETVEAATKYMVSDLLLALHEFVMGKLKDVSSACLLFDQLIKIERTFGNEALHRPLPMDDLRCVIQVNCADAFKSESFEHIDQETLIEIMKFDELNIKEIDLLKSCIRHVDVELKRLGLDSTADNKNEMFTKVKNLIRFSDLNAMEFGKIAGIEDYLSAVDLSTIFLHLSVPSRPTIKYLSPRNAFLSLYDSGRKRKRIKDQNKPKLPLSAFFWFSQDERVKNKALDPEYGVGDIAQEIGKRWSVVGPFTKSLYVNKAERDEKRYEVEINDYYKRKYESGEDDDDDDDDDEN